MATIINKQPIQSSKFDKFWMTSLNIIFPSETTTGVVIAKLQPYDGKHVITSNSRVCTHTNFSKESFDSNILELIDLVQTEADRLYLSEASLASFKVFSHDPQKRTTAFFTFVDGTYKTIEDCFGYAATDPTFGANISTLLDLLAKSAKLPTIN
jgi:hypothetical protein